MTPVRSDYLPYPMNRSSEAPQAHVLALASIHVGLAAVFTLFLWALAAPGAGMELILMLFLIVYCAFAPLIIGAAALTHQAGWLRWTSGDLNRHTRQLGAKLADPSQEF